MDVKVKRIGGHNLPLPKYETNGASGFDLRARVDADKTHAHNFPSVDNAGRHSLWIFQFKPVVIPCGFAFEIPDGYELQVRPRSGLSKRGVHVDLGTIDSDYRGEVGVIVTNLSEEPFIINDGDRIAQGIIAPVWQASFAPADELSDSQRGAGGFGSTGKL